MRKTSSARVSFALPGLGGLVLSGARPLIGVALALVVSAGLIWIAGANPIKAYLALLVGAVGSVQSISNTLVRASPLLLGGLGVAIGVKAGLFNIGVEGQIYLGAIGATAVGLIPMPVPNWLHLSLALMAAAVGGALWGAVPAYLRAYRGVSEVVTTLMLNYVGIYLASWFVHEPQPLAEPGAFFPMSPPILPSALLPILIKGTSLHPGAFLGIFLCIVFYLILQYTPFGFRTRMIGHNPEASRYAGAMVARQLFLVMLVSAALGGLAGAGEVLGLKLRLFDFFASGVGYEGISVALLAAGNPLAVILAALFFGALKAGATTMQISTGIETPMALVIQALVLLFVIAVGFAERVRLERQEDKKETTTGVA